MTKNPKQTGAPKMAASFLNRFDLNDDAMVKGIERKVGGFTFRLAYYGQANPKYVEHLVANAQKLQSGDNALVQKTNREMFADVVILKWDMKDDQGKDFACTRKNKIWLLDTYPHFYDTLVEIAANPANYSTVNVGKVVKN